jgi:GMP reductase
VNGKKEYFGSASEKNKGNVRNIEGFTTYLTPSHTIASKIREIHEDLASAISYAGGKDLFVLDLSRVKYNIVTQ